MGSSLCAQVFALLVCGSHFFVPCVLAPPMSKAIFYTTGRAHNDELTAQERSELKTMMKANLEYTCQHTMKSDWKDLVMKAWKNPPGDSKGYFESSNNSFSFCGVAFKMEAGVAKIFHTPDSMYTK